MESLGSDWYKRIWSLDIKNQSWVENTNKEVDFIEKTLGLTGKERILDLACGYGRHALEFAKRGYSVVGVDITKVYIEDAKKEAERNKLSASFIWADIRDIGFEKEFNVVLNLADGAIGYLENEQENLKIFDVLSRALKPGGKHFMDIMNGGYAHAHYPCKLWDAGEAGLTLSNFEWDEKTKILMYEQWDCSYGNQLSKPDFSKGNPTRLYDLTEVEAIMNERHMKVQASFSDYNGKQSDDNGIQLMVYSEKEKE